MAYRLGRELAWQPKIRRVRRLAYRVFGTLDVRAKIAAAHILPIILNSKRMPQVILDAGCGRGIFSFLLARLLPRTLVIGVDISNEKIFACQKIKETLNFHNLVFFHADLARLPLKTSVDIVVCIDVLEHVLEDSEVLSSLARTLKPQGQIILHTPLSHRHDQRLLRRWQSYFKDFTADDYVFQRYDEASLCQKVTNAGLYINELRFTYGFWGELAWELDALATMLGFHARVMMLPLINFLLALESRSDNSKYHNGVLLIASRS